MKFAFLGQKFENEGYGWARLDKEEDMHGMRAPDERGHPSNYYKATTRDRAFFSFTLCPHTTHSERIKVCGRSFYLPVGSARHSERIEVCGRSYYLPLGSAL